MLHANCPTDSYRTWISGSPLVAALARPGVQNAHWPLIGRARAQRRHYPATNSPQKDCYYQEAKFVQMFSGLFREERLCYTDTQNIFEMCCRDVKICHLQDHTIANSTSLSSMPSIGIIICVFQLKSTNLKYMEIMQLPPPGYCRLRRHNVSDKFS